MKFRRSFVAVNSQDRRHLAEMINSTLPKLLLDKATLYKDRVAMRKKYKGIWQEISWSMYLERVREFALGLIQLGIQKGDHASILGENCPEWVFADMAIQSLGAVSIGIYPTDSAEQVKYILDHSESRFVVVMDQEQADKVLEVRQHLPLLSKIIVVDMKGLRHYREPLIISYQSVEMLGREELRKDPDSFTHLVARTDPNDVAIIVYTSGTTGHPKGAMISHRNILHQNIKALAPILNFADKEELLSYLPLCHILERNVSVAIPLVFGNTISFAESINTVQQNLQEIRPTFFAAVPRILEKIYSSVQIKLDDSTHFKRWMYQLWMPVGRRVSEFRMDKEQRIPLLWLMLYVFGYLFVFRSIQSKIGLLHCRNVMSGGAPIAPEILTFFRSLGIRTIEMYGLTETSGTVSGPLKKIKNGSVGEPASKALELRFDNDGEILLRGDSIFVGYYRDSEATNAAIRDGWLHTGDVGQLDEDGHLYIVDRKKDIIITSGGKNVSPSEIENKLKCSIYIKEAIVIGDRRKYISALIQIDYDNVGNWAQRNKIPYTTYRSLAESPHVYDLIRNEIDIANEDLAQVERVKKFHILKKELDQDDEELTATQKVKRKTVEKRFRQEIESMYGN